MTTKTFRVVVPSLRVRRTPSLGLTNIKLGQALEYGQEVAVELESLTIHKGLAWWKHAAGWSPSQRVDGSEVFMVEIESEGAVLAAGGLATNTQSDKPLEFEVLLDGLRVRTSPRAGFDNISPKRLKRGQKLKVFPQSRTVADELIWWQHKDGWSAQGAVDGHPVFMQVISPEARRQRPPVLLEVPWVSQIDADSPLLNDCGQAALLMLLRYYGRAPAGMRVKTLTDRHPGPTFNTDLERLGADYGLTLKLLFPAAKAQEMAKLRAYLEAAMPVIILVDYNSLRFRATPLETTLAHWLVLVGFQGEEFIVHDPNWAPNEQNMQGGIGGAHLRLSLDRLTLAYRGTALV
jgi:hypothetical protein